MERCAVKKFVAFCIAFMVVTLCVAWVRIAKETAESPKSDIVVVLDAGHGGIDCGALAADGAPRRALSKAN